MSDLWQTHVKSLTDTCQTSDRHMSNLWQTCVRSVTDMSNLWQTHIKPVSDTCQTCGRHVSNLRKMRQTCYKHISDLWLIDWLIDDHLYSAIPCSLEQTHCARMRFYMSNELGFFIAHFWISTKVVYLQRWWLVPHETAAVLAQVLCTPYNNAPCHFMQSHMRKVYACLAITCHLHFWRNDRSFTCYCGNTGVERIPK